MSDKLYTPEEAAERLNVKANTIRAWLRDGTLKGVKLGGKIWRVTEEDIKEFIESSKPK